MPSSHVHRSNMPRSSRNQSSSGCAPDVSLRVDAHDVELLSGHARPEDMAA
jgi:hypothetical protein